MHHNKNQKKSFHKNLVGIKTFTFTQLKAMREILIDYSSLWIIPTASPDE